MKPIAFYVCCGSILSLVQIFFSFVLFKTDLHILPYPKTKELNYTKDKIVAQHLRILNSLILSQIV